jgi:aspartate kinase
MESDTTFGSLHGGQSGMKAARSMAMLTYRTSDSFIEQQTDVEEKVEDFNASSYIRYQGDKFVARFDSLCYHYLTRCLDSHNIGRGRNGEATALSRIKIPTLVIGIDTDTLIPVRFQKFMAEHLPNGRYIEISSQFGHDGFLVENEKIISCLNQFDEEVEASQETISRTVLKFGGRSLADDRLALVLDIIEKAKSENALTLVVSARADSTDRLLAIYAKVLSDQSFEKDLEEFFKLQRGDGLQIHLSDLEIELRSVLEAVRQLGIEDAKVKDRVLAFGERFSARFLAALLKENGHNTEAIDSDRLLQLYEVGHDLNIDMVESESRCHAFFDGLDADIIPVITGYFGRDEQGHIRTLGRNGTNYSATLIARFIKAREVQNWTDVDGIFTADPRFVPNAEPIAHISYREANELANFGVNVLHSKTILPLMNSEIPLRILNTRRPESKGTLIDAKGSGKGMKAVSKIDGVSLVRIEGKGLSGRIGIDGRIFNTLSQAGISVRLISQASSERGIGFVIDTDDARRAERLLQNEFEQELLDNEISTIEVDDHMAIIAIVGRHNYALEKAIMSLRKNDIWMHLISNSISGEHISLVVSAKRMKKALRLVHSQVFGVVKVMNVFAIGKGTVGGRFIDQIIETHGDVAQQRNLIINVIGVADSSHMTINENGLDREWRRALNTSEIVSNVSALISTLRKSGMENIVVVDNSSSTEISKRYKDFISAGFDLVASNKKANSMDLISYLDLRKLLKHKGRFFYYETNVGAGLPVIDTLKQLYNSADPVSRVRGVFSGSLSYLFNTYCKSQASFSDILLEAKNGGLTEPDPREDLSGIDVARKLIILAREVGLKIELDEVQVQSLVPDTFSEEESVHEFLSKLNLLDEHYGPIKESLKDGQVLRYIGDLDVANKNLKVSLECIDSNSPLGGLKNSDTIFEIFTKGYGEHPIVIQGAGAGAEVTARGVYSDLLRVGMQL